MTRRMSLRGRLFLTTAAVLAVATVAAGLLSRRATLVEERQILGPRQPPRIDEVASAAQRAFASGGWSAVRTELAAAAAREGVRYLALDSRQQPVAGSTPALERVSVKAADDSGLLRFEIESDGARSNVEVRGVPTFPIESAGGAAGRVYVLPGAEDRGSPPEVMPQWIRSTIATAVIALVLAFVLGGRILRPVSELTLAARRMRQGDLAARVPVRGDDELARLAAAFNEMAERLAHTERTQRQMVSDVAHELRSPVTNLRCGLEAIQDGLAAATRDRIDVLHAETLLLQRLIADLQDLALAEAGGLSLRIAPAEIAPIAGRVARTDPGGPRVFVEVAPAGDVVLADAARLEQMLRNLVSNAQRHTPAAGRITISTRKEGSVVVIAVSDTGSGIAAEHLPQVFDRFYRVDASRDRATGGAGLGLAIVRRLAEAQQGTVHARSGGPGAGATFEIRLPAP